MVASADSLARIIAQVESAGNQYAMRFEPKEYAQELSTPDEGERALIARLNICTLETADVIWAASWGLFQIMGFSLYEQGWRSSVGAFLANPTAQTLAFARFLDAKKLPTSWEAMRNDIGALEHFAYRYNGSVEYAAKMQAAAKTLGI